MRSRLARFGTPTIADILFVVLLLRILQLGATDLFNDPGTGWHLRTGDRVLATGAVPTADTYSYTRAGRPWVETQWLGDVGLSLLHRVGGLSLIALATAGTLAALFRWIYRTHVTAGGWPAIAALTVLAAACGASGHFLARPLVASTIGVPVCFWWATEYCRGRVPMRRLAILVPAAAIWCNIHPGVLGGIATVGIVGAATLLSGAWRSGDARGEALRRGAGLLAVAAGMAAATILNPYGIGWHRWVHRLMGMRVLGQWVDEWMPPVWGRPETLAAAALVTFAGLGVAARRRTTTFAEGVVILFWAWHAAQSARHLPLMVLLVALQLSRIAGGRPPPHPGGTASPIRRWITQRVPLFSESMRTAEAGTHGGLLSIVAVGILGCLLAAGLRVPVIGLGVARLPEARYSSAVIAHLRAHPPAGRILNDLDYGGFLIHRLPTVPVFVDDRFELYGETFLEEYRSAVLAPERNAAALLDRWRIDTVIMQSRLPLCGWLAARGEWEESHRDRVVTVYRRRASHGGRSARASTSQR